jgi:hypothetical protein
LRRQAFTSAAAASAVENDRALVRPNVPIRP